MNTAPKKLTEKEEANKGEQQQEKTIKEKQNNASRCKDRRILAKGEGTRQRWRVGKPAALRRIGGTKMWGKQEEEEGDQDKQVKEEKKPKQIEKKIE